MVREKAWGTEKESMMKIDMHCHVIGSGRDLGKAGEDVYFNPDDNQHWFTRLLAGLVEDELMRMEADLNRDGGVSTGEYLELLNRMLRESEETDGVVLLALDALFDPETGLLDERRTDLWVSNRFLSRAVQELNERLIAEGWGTKRFYFGASVSPNRKDWREELDLADAAGAVLVKWIASTQHIRMADRRHREFYRELAERGLPLLCHVGPEYSFPEGIRNKELDDFRGLSLALECGTTVIAAHCASPVFPGLDPNRMEEFSGFMQEANAGGAIMLWADTSALSLSTRVALIPEILRIFPPEWLVHGTDFPIPIDGWPHMPFVTKGITTEEYLGIVKTKNPFDRDVRIKRAHGFRDSILENAEKVLRLPGEA